MDYVFDTYAVMVYLRREKNHQIVRTKIFETLAGTSKSFMSIINLGELFYMQARKSGIEKAESSIRFVKRAGILVEPVSTERVMNAARVKANVSLSYADAFAASLALELNVILITGDKEYIPLEPNLKVLWL